MGYRHTQRALKICRYILPGSQLPSYCSREKKHVFKWQQNAKEKQILLAWNPKQTNKQILMSQISLLLLLECTDQLSSHRTNWKYEKGREQKLISWFSVFPVNKILPPYNIFHPPHSLQNKYWWLECFIRQSEHGFLGKTIKVAISNWEAAH